MTIQLPQFGGFGGLLGLTAPQSFQPFMQGQGGLLGAGFGALFGDKNGVVDLGGNNFFQPGQGFFQQAQGAVQQGAEALPNVSGLNFGSLFGGLF